MGQKKAPSHTAYSKNGMTTPNPATAVKRNRDSRDVHAGSRRPPPKPPGNVDDCFQGVRKRWLRGGKKRMGWFPGNMPFKNFRGSERGAGEKNETVTDGTWLKATLKGGGGVGENAGWPGRETKTFQD